MSIDCHNAKEICKLLDELNSLLPSKVSIKQDGNIFILYKRKGKGKGVKQIGSIFGPVNLEAQLKLMIFEERMK